MILEIALKIFQEMENFNDTNEFELKNIIYFS